MSWWLVGLVVVLGFLAINNHGHHYRFLALVKTLKELSNIIAINSDLSEDHANQVKSIWEETRQRAELRYAVQSMVFLLIAVFLVVLGVRGHL